MQYSYHCYWYSYTLCAYLYSYTSMQDYKHAVLLAEKIIEELNEKIYSEF